MYHKKSFQHLPATFMEEIKTVAVTVLEEIMKEIWFSWLLFSDQDRANILYWISSKSHHHISTSCRYLQFPQLSPNVWTTPMRAMWCQKCLPLSVQLKGKHCRKPHCHSGVVDTFGHCLMLEILICGIHYSKNIPLLPRVLSHLDTFRLWS
jgi:hypothetical protein